MFRNKLRINMGHEVRDLLCCQMRPTDRIVKQNGSVALEIQIICLLQSTQLLDFIFVTNQAFSHFRVGIAICWRVQFSSQNHNLGCLCHDECRTLVVIKPS